MRHLRTLRQNPLFRLRSDRSKFAVPGLALATCLFIVGLILIANHKTGVGITLFAIAALICFVLGVVLALLRGMRSRHE